MIMGSGGPSTRAIVEGGRHRRGARGRAGSDRSRCPRRCARPPRRRSPPVQDQGRQLFHLVGLRHVQPLHRQCLRDHPARQAGHHLRRRRRGARLDALGALRRHGRHVEPFQRPPGGRLARLRQESRRLRHRRRRRRRRPRGARARQGARRPHLWRDRRLRRHLGRLRHGAAFRRRRGALHEDGARRGRRADRLHQPACHLDADRRPHRDATRSRKCSATSARRSRAPSR